MANTWIFQATASVFDIDGFLRAAPTQAKWRASIPGAEKSMRPHDEVYLWRAQGGGDPSLSGVVARGEIVETVTFGPDDSPSARFWLDRADAKKNEDRVLIRLTRYAKAGEHVPRTNLSDDPVLGRAKIMKMSSGTNFPLKGDEPDRLSRLWEGGHRAWTPDDLRDALDFYEPRDEVGLALRAGRYLLDARKKLIAFMNCDPRSRFWNGRPNSPEADAWDARYDPSIGRIIATGGTKGEAA